jgi:hypothetical protein
MERSTHVQAATQRLQSEDEKLLSAPVEGRCGIRARESDKSRARERDEDSGYRSQSVGSSKEPRGKPRGILESLFIGCRRSKLRGIRPSKE